VSLAQKNRNPGNLRYAGQRESIGQDARGFAIFPTHPAGWRALVRQIKLDQKRRMSVRQFVYKYAPPSENETESYLRFVVEGLVTKPDAPLDIFSPYALAGLIAAREGYFEEGDYAAERSTVQDSKDQKG
jgi:hypothetical protein